MSEQFLLNGKGIKIIMQPETQSGMVLRTNAMLDRYVITAREKISFLSVVNKSKGATKGKLLAGKINEKCTIIIKLLKNMTNRVNQSAFKLSDGKLERSRRIFF